MGFVIKILKTMFYLLILDLLAVTVLFLSVDLEPFRYVGF